ncbi:hypothetical protein BmR1_04g05160 [Babesia microti strain RI]|uniref:Uncharacterized protein n=1 Tax=Babesia microti (strain RI) TaxID=1133968 RepID=I7JCJ1_BABMR|nr:hypothetical protein BmR1_04g05160 [Babesia microti strain RI]CCF75230.1 hypothetical protein BmR1_04g05160 [Babesia microti strain RI]|eukprot:XP_012649638.1 hypothetical protein BmR1_04g05160 [Babesia microti strain RI]
MRQNGYNKLKSLVRWLDVENTLLAKILERNYMQHRRQPFLLYTRLALKHSAQFAKRLKSNVKSLHSDSACDLEEINELSDKCTALIIRAGVELSRIHVHRHFTQLITTLIACLSRLHLLMGKWRKSSFHKLKAK